MKVIEVRSNGTKRVSTINNEVSRTDQSYKDDCDVNKIIARAMKTGQISHLSKYRGQYADVSQITDLQGAMEAVQKANEAFMTIPAQLRKRFGNDPQEFIKYLQDPSNIEESIQLGLRERPKATDSQQVKPDEGTTDKK